MNSSHATSTRRRRDASTRSVRADILFAFAIAVALGVAYLLREILLLLYVSALFAVVLTPLVSAVLQLRIRRWSPGRGLAILLLMMAAASCAALFFAFAMPPVLHDAREFMKELPWRGPQMLSRLRSLPFLSRIDVRALNAKVQGLASNLAEYILLSISDWAGKLADIVATVVLTVYFLLEGDVAYRWVVSFLPPQPQQRLDAALRRAEARMGRWLLGQGLLMVILGLTSTIVFALLRIRYAYALGVLMGALNIIPLVGGMFTMSLVLLASAMDSWEKLAGAAIFYAIYTQVESTYLTPRIMRSSVDLPGLAVLVALLLGSKLDGVVGAMVAVPTAVLVAVLVDEYLRSYPSQDVRAQDVRAQNARGRHDRGVSESGREPVEDAD